MRSVLARLRALGSALVEQPVEVVLARQWAFDPSSGRILVDEAALRRWPWERSAAIMLHEIGHALWTRGDVIVWARLSLPELLGADEHVLDGVRRCLVNVFEDSRVEYAIQERFAGARFFFDARTRCEQASTPTLAVDEFESVRFLAGHLSEWRRVGSPTGTTAAAIALERTRHARTRYTTTTASRWGFGPSGRDDAQRAAIAVLNHDLLPEFGRLVLADVHALGRWMADAPSRRRQCVEALERGGGATWKLVTEGVAEGRSLANTPVEGRLAAKAFGYALAARLGRLGREDAPRERLSPEAFGLRVRRMCARRLRRPGARSSRWQPGGACRFAVAEATWADVFGPVRAQVASLVRVVEASLPLVPNGDPRGVRTREGQAVDRRALVRSLNGSCDDDIFWSRRQVRSRAVAVGVLVDRSGSMRHDERALGAARAACLLAEASEQLALSVTVWGFRETLEREVGPTRTLRPEDRARIAALADGANGGNDDAACLQDAWRELSREPADRYLLFVLSDASPSAGADADDVLRATVESLRRDPRLCLIGIGVGAGTAQVSRLYPRGCGDVPVEELAARVGQMLRAELLRPGRAASSSR